MSKTVDTAIVGGAPLASQLKAWNRAWLNGEGAIGERIKAELKFESLLDLLPDDGVEPAVRGTASRRAERVSFAQLHDFLGSDRTSFGAGPGDRCAIAVPEGPELAVCLLAVSMRCVAVPLNPWNPEGEIRADLRAAGATSVIVASGEDFDHVRRAALSQGVAVVELDARPGGLFELRGARVGEHRSFNAPDDVALELFTSGTSGNKKLVSIRLIDVVVGAACIAAALELGPGDRGYNMMPLFHVGGIVRNVYAPLLAGSGMVYSDGFDAAMFWDELERDGFSWYYASPTMHDSILDEGEGRSGQPRLRFICNAAGGLLPSTADRLRERFSATILPGYGMTECMPIALPPLDDDLAHRGASGRVLGPEVRIVDEGGAPAAVGTPGRIILRGAPLSEVVTGGDRTLPFGWFDTGDIGTFDDDGFLTIVGRSKDVIKRGGETLAPAEIEDALVAHPDIAGALAFGIPHPALGEAVGAVVVARDGRRVDLETLAPYLATDLAPAKWPVLLVYMDELPRNLTGKLLRVGLARRMGIEGVNEKAPARERLLEARCPEPGTPISVPIEARPVEVSGAAIEQLICDALPVIEKALVRVDAAGGPIRAAVAGRGLEAAALRHLLAGSLHDYLIPRSIAVMDEFPVDPETGLVDISQLMTILDTPQIDATPADEVEAFLFAEWRRGLGEDRQVGLDSDFFDELGGDSLTAVRIIANVRKEFGVALRPTAIFRDRTIRGLAVSVRTAMQAGADRVATCAAETPLDPRLEPKSQLAPTTLAIQLVPLAVLPAVLRLGQLVAWVVTWWYLRAGLGLRGWWVVFAALIVAVFARNTVAPLVAIGLKWILVGRHRVESAPLWGPRYLRWWLAHQVRATAGLGIFSLSYPLTALYYRLMGAKVGRRTRIDPSADLGEFDLLTIGDDAFIDEAAIVRPFVLDGAMESRPITIGANASIGGRATIVPGSVLPPDTEVAPLGTSDDPAACNQGTRGLSRARTYAPPVYLKAVGLAIMAAARLAALAPGLLMIHALLARPLASGAGGITVIDLLLRLSSPQRLLAASGILLVGTLVAPFVYLGCVIAVKWLLIGRFRAGVDMNRPWPMFERWLMWRLLPDGRFGGVAPLLGSNFSAVSVIYRLLGAKVGHRIYWSGSGHVLTEYDLFEVGDDVTFGSRSTYLMTSESGSRPIRIETGANVADRCVLAPGVVVEKNAVLGSGTLAPEGFAAPAGSTWIGQDGRTQPIELEAPTPRRVDADTLRPYGRAMYFGEATYRVLPLAAHIMFNVVWAAVCAIYRSAPLLVAFLLTRFTLLGSAHQHGRVGEFVLVLAGFYLPTQLVFAVVALLIVGGTKWLLIGRRVAGEHLWTESGYCQRWKIHKVISSLTGGWLGSRDLLDFLGGSAFLVWYFRAEGARIGSNVCLYPNGADPMMEEPEFLTIGDGACIDQAVLIAHLNTRGEWMMGPIEIAPGATLRASSRVMMESTIGAGATLLEGTLVLAGDAAGPRSTWKGWPGEAVAASRQQPAPATT